jgi:hypothetical protein
MARVLTEERRPSGRSREPKPDILTRLSLPAFGVVLAAVLAAVNGLRATPAMRSILKYARSPFHPPRLGNQGYIVTSPVTPVLAHVLHATGSIDTLAGFHLALIVVVVGGSLAYVQRVEGDLTARLATLALFCGPLGAVLFTWLGVEDPVTVAAATILVSTRRPRTAALAALVLGINHFEQGTVIVATLLVLDVADGFRLRHKNLFVPSIGGLVAGRVVVALYLRVCHIDGSFDRLAWLRHAGTARMAHHAVESAPLLVVSLFAAWWIYVVVIGRDIWKRERRIVLGLAVAMAFVLAIMVFTDDETRVFALLSWPILLWSMRWAVANVSRDRLKRVATWCLLAGVLVPFRLDIYAGREVGLRGVSALVGR